MGRKKIQISRITDERNRQVTFNKRKFGVMKKAYELSVLCDCEIALIIFSSSNKLYQYASTDMDKVLLKYTEYNEPHESLTNKNIIELQVNAQKENKNGTMSPDSPEPEDSYTLTPRTEAKYNKIDEDFQIMMQRNQQLTTGSGTRNNMATGSYSLPVSVPVTVPVIGTYNDSMLQSSPQMAHNSISPRPSSSETDSVYPSGGILEMSNGYPHSASPLGGSPSPGPSPGIGSLQAHNNNNNTHNTHNKKFHFENAVQTIKQSPSGGSGSSGSRSTNLRVVIPTPMNPAISGDDISYVEHTRQQTNLNTPVVALQTPIPGLTNYTTTLGSFGAQDFSLNPDLMIGPWSAASNHSQNSAAAAAAAMGSLQHSSGLPHLAVSNSTPPPSTSPLSVKIKAEPISPPREHHNNVSHQHHHGPGVPGGGVGGINGTPSGSSTSNNAGGGGSASSNNVNATSNNSGANSQQNGGGNPQQQLTSMGNVVVSGNSGASSASSLGANLSHSHLIHSRPSSTGHLTPTPGSVTPTNAPSPVDIRHLSTGGSHLPEYDAPSAQAHKRPRISEGWAT